tara:strand:+ start:191 stop:481 length:291 start_codon:yes stop_codon:yes gene_type:complete
MWIWFLISLVYFIVYGILTLLKFKIRSRFKLFITLAIGTLLSVFIFFWYLDSKVSDCFRENGEFICDYELKKEWCKKERRSGDSGCYSWKYTRDTR